MDFRNRAHRFSFEKKIKDLGFRPSDPSQSHPTSIILNIPFFVIDAFKLENITKNEIEQRKSNYQLRKGIYEPELRF